MFDSFATPWAIACQTPLSKGFPSQEYWSELPFLPPGDLPEPGVKSTSPAWQVDSLLLRHQGSPPTFILRFVTGFDDALQLLFLKTIRT